jgi:hypothetical protein
VGKKRRTNGESGTARTGVLLGMIITRRKSINETYRYHENVLPEVTDTARKIAEGARGSLQVPVVFKDSRG